MGPHKKNNGTLGEKSIPPDPTSNLDVLNNHRMPIVTGRYAKINLLARVCKLCILSDVGYEYHYLLRCPYFCHQRNLFLKAEYIPHANSKIKMKHVLTGDNTRELIDLSKFIKHILDKFAEKCRLIINYNTIFFIVYITCNTLVLSHRVFSYLVFIILRPTNK